MQEKVFLCDEQLFMFQSLEPNGAMFIENWAKQYKIMENHEILYDRETVEKLSW